MKDSVEIKNVFKKYGYAMERMTVAIIQMKNCVVCYFDIFFY